MAKQNAKQIEMIQTADLIPYARNARTHSDQQVAQIAGSIQEFGFCNPVLIDQSNGIIAGHGRVLAAQKLKLETVPCLRLSHLTDAQKRAYVLADNRIALSSGWDEAMLANELSDLHADDFDMALLGFDTDELENLLKLSLSEQQPAGDIIEDEVPKPPADPITKPGDLWILGEHRLLCGDSTKAEDVARLMDGAKANAVVTDPPYGIDAANMTLGSGKKQFAERGDWDKSRLSIRSLLTFADDVVIWGGNYFADELPITNDWLCWHKKNDGLSFSEFELAWTNLGRNCRHLSHHWSGEEKRHPTQKPLPVMVWCVGLVAGPVVYDPFLGSGTTLIAAEQLNRKCYGMEISPAYCDVIVKRWETLTGKKAELENKQCPAKSEISE